MLEFGETPDDWPEDIAICEKGQLGAFGMFDHINLFSELVSQIISSTFGHWRAISMSLLILLTQCTYFIPLSYKRCQRG